MQVIYDLRFLFNSFMMYITHKACVVVEKKLYNSCNILVSTVSINKITFYLIILHSSYEMFNINPFCTNLFIDKFVAFRSRSCFTTYGTAI